MGCLTLSEEGMGARIERVGSVAEGGKRKVSVVGVLMNKNFIIK